MKKRFPFLEVVFVIVMLGVVSLWGLWQYKKMVLSSRLDVLKQQVRLLAQAQMQYYKQHGAYTRDLRDVAHVLPAACTHQVDADGDPYLACPQGSVFYITHLFPQGGLVYPGTSSQLLISWQEAIDPAPSTWIKPGESVCEASVRSAVALAVCKERCYSKFKSFASGGAGITKFCHVKEK